MRTLAWLTLAAGALLAGPGAGDQPWIDNDRQFASGDPAFHYRRSEHFRIQWARGAAKEAEANAEFGAVTEELAQGNLQMLEQLWHVVHDPPPAGLGFPPAGESAKPDVARDGKLRRANLVVNNTGIWAGGAWGACDEWGFPLFALPPSYLRHDPPSGATPHEYGHTVLINGGGFNETPFDGMWHEATANWIQLQFVNSYPGPGGVGTQPYLSIPHGRNYYDCWQILEHFREDPRYGAAFVAKLWTQANGNRAKGAEYIFDAMARLDPSGTVDPRNALKDALGRVAARAVTWDYERRPFFEHQSPRTTDPFSETYRRGYTELVRRQGDPAWFRVPFAHAPMQGGYDIVPVALPGKTGGGYPVAVDFRPLWDAARGSDWRATLVAVNDDGEPRYGTQWNGGVNAITLAADENRLFLAVAATPDLLPFEGFSHPLVTDEALFPQAYEVSFPGTAATAHETRPARPDVPGKAHGNGGGFVADTAHADETAFVGPGAMVLERARVLGDARVTDFAVVAGDAVVKDSARVSGYALVRGEAEISGRGKVRDWATVDGRWRVSGNGRALERAWLVDRGELHGDAVIKGNTADFGGADVGGYAIKDGDCCNGANVDRQVLTGWVWGTDQAYADGRPDCGALYCSFPFARRSPNYALDGHGVLHGYLMGAPRTVSLEGGAGGALELNGKDQWAELKRDVADLRETTIAAWICWAGGADDERILFFGDGGGKYLYLTPRAAATGKLRLVASAGGAAAERALDGRAAPPARVWTHVAVTFTAGAAILYVDGKPVAEDREFPVRPEDVLGPNTLSTRECTFLGRGAEGGFYTGLMTDFRVYARPQEPEAIVALATRFADRCAKAVADPAAKGPPPRAPGGFLAPPALVGEGAVVMSAPRPEGDRRPVEYRFTCPSEGGHSSGWISTNRWTDCRLEPGRTYAYVFRVRDGGGESPDSAPASVAIPADAAAPEGVDFETGPAGISPGAVRMTARRVGDDSGLVEYEFIRSDGLSSGWRAGRTFTDTAVAAGAGYRYAVRARDSRGHVSETSPARAAVARDDTPPARYVPGEWATRPYATLDNRVAMRATSVTGGDGAPRIEADPVEYSFECVSGGGPDSGWVESPAWRSPPLPDGDYVYRFRMRDRSPQRNETGSSSAEPVAVTPLTGYHETTVPKISGLPEGALVCFAGRVTAVAKDALTVSAGGASVTVTTRAAGGTTDPAWKGREVRVAGCVWEVTGGRRVVWAEVEPK